MLINNFTFSCKTSDFETMTAFVRGTWLRWIAVLWVHNYIAFCLSSITRLICLKVGCIDASFTEQFDKANKVYRRKIWNWILLPSGGDHSTPSKYKNYWAKISFLAFKKFKIFIKMLSYSATCQVPNNRRSPIITDRGCDNVLRDQSCRIWS
jgi:hypothetical protein